MAKLKAVFMVVLFLGLISLFYLPSGLFWFAAIPIVILLVAVGVKR